ncbi:hypothetical protein LguiA_024837 [Lonicera macranthoides]
MFIVRVIFFLDGFSVLFRFLQSFETNGFFRVLNFLVRLILILQICAFFQSKMAFSQVEIASNSPFDCVLRDHNRQNRYSRDTNARTAFQKNLKDLVRDRLQSCISTPSTNSDSDSNENTNPPIDNAECKSRNGESNKTSSILRKSKANDRWSRAREMVFAIENPEGSNLGGVSSLVQKWRHFEAESKNLNCLCNSGNTINEAPQINSEGGEFVDERFENLTMIDETLADWESDTTATSIGPPSSLGRDLDATESERINVADIIRKLKNGPNVANNSLPQVRISSDQTEQKGLCPVMFTPKIRGRQAFSDLLMQMERDRHHELQGLGERKPVSRFPHKGRIQALLRVKLLRGGSECKDNQLLSPTICKLNGVARGSTIMHLRERFSALVDHCASNSRSPFREVVNHSPDSEKSSTSYRLAKEIIDKTQEPETSSTSLQLREETNNHHKATSSTSRPKEVEAGNSSTSKRPREEEIHHLEVSALTSHPKEVADNTTPDVENISTSKRPREEIRHCEVTYSTNRGKLVNNALSVESSSISNELKEATTHHKDPNTCVHITPQVQNSVNLSEEINFGPRESEQEADNKNLTRSVDELINDSLYLQGDWEEQDIIGDDFDQQSEREEEQRVEGNNDWISDIARPRSDWEGLRKERYQEMLDPYMENGDIRVLLQRSWRSNNRNHEVSDDSDQFASPSLLQSPSTISNSYSQYSRRRSSVGGGSLQQEMELVYDLRGHMEQLHQEMSEIRKSIKSCVSMQVKLQRSIKQEVATAVSHSVRRDGKESFRRVPKKERCCICSQMPVDSLLYRCGHMCTCFKCAHELQWSEGKCPICRAPILDIVRPYAR